MFQISKCSFVSLIFNLNLENYSKRQLCGCTSQSCLKFTDLNFILNFKFFHAYLIISHSRHKTMLQLHVYLTQKYPE